MTHFNHTSGLAFICDDNGTILKIISDHLGLSHRIVAGKSLSLVVDRGSMTKALDFVLAVKAEGAVCGWELGMPTENSVKVFHFAGTTVGGELVVVAANTLEEVEQLLQEFGGIWNEQANLLRSTVKENVRLSSEAITRESGLYDELGRLNNELANLQRELTKKNIQLERLNEEKNRFLGMAAHDLRNPLGAIQMYSEFLLDEAAEALDEEQMEFVSTIHASSQFMLQLVNDLLDVAKIESGKLDLSLESIDLKQAVQSGSLEIEDYTNFQMSLRFLAGSLGVPFIPCKSGLMTDIVAVEGFSAASRQSSKAAAKKLSSMDNPFGPPGDRVLLLPALNPDTALIHAQYASVDGTVRIKGLTFADLEQAKSARAVIVSCEEIVSEEWLRQDPDQNALPPFLVDAVVPAPWGAHPTACHQYYDYDPDHLKQYRDAAHDELAFKGYLEEWVHDLGDQEAYLAKVGENALNKVKADPELGYARGLDRR